MLTVPDRNDLANFIIQNCPYAFATLALNQRQLKESVARERMRRACKDLALRLDQSFLGSRHVTKFNSTKRFNAIGFFEKLIGNPHIHLVFIAPKNTPHQIDCRTKHLMRKLNTEVDSLSPADLSKYFKSETHAKFCAGKSLVECIHRSLTAQVSSISCPVGLSKYITKDYNRHSSEFLILSEFHSSKTPRDWRSTA